MRRQTAHKRKQPEQCQANKRNERNERNKRGKATDSTGKRTEPALARGPRLSKKGKCRQARLRPFHVKRAKPQQQARGGVPAAGMTSARQSGRNQRECSGWLVTFARARREACADRVGRCRACGGRRCGRRLPGHGSGRDAAIAAGNKRVDVGGKMLGGQHHFQAKRLASRQESRHAGVGLTRFCPQVCFPGNPGLTGDVFLLELSRSAQRPQLPERFASASRHGCTVHVGLQSPMKKKCADVHSSIEHAKRSVCNQGNTLCRFLVGALRRLILACQ